MKNTALLLVDLQNDFLNPKGAYGRARQGNPGSIEAIVSLQDELFLRFVSPRLQRLQEQSNVIQLWALAQRYVPVPDNSITIGFDDALSWIVTVPDFDPVDVGENVTLIEQLAPAATLEPQLDFIAN